MEVALHRSLAELSLRVDALAAGRVRQPRLVDRAWALIPRHEAPPELPALTALDRELDRAGVHTSADARLLCELGLQEGRAGSISRGLESRTGEAIRELEAAVRHAERALLAGRLAPGAITALERGLLRATRAVKVTDIFAHRDPTEDLEIFPRALLQAGAIAPKSAAVAIARLWADRAAGRFDDVVQRRRELDAAHELLLRISSDAGRDRDRVRLLRLEVSAARQELQGEPPFHSLSEVLRHIRRTAEKNPAAAYRAVRGLYSRAVEAGRADIAGPAHAVLSAFAAPAKRSNSAAAADDARLAQIALALEDRSVELFDLAEGCARLFDVGAASEEVRPRLAGPTPRRVPWPTSQLGFDVASGLNEARDFVIQDPRRIVYDLAAGRQLVRGWLDNAPDPGRAGARRTAVRVYVCDASGSMHGARARFRDALLLAELLQLQWKAGRGESFEPLYFCYFNERPSELKRVGSADEAAREMALLLTHSPAEGQTDITLALEWAFESIRGARRADPYLARATVVLVTDGEDRIDVERIRAARSPIDDVRIALSFIALGQENRDLRAIAREQRDQGERAFYTHLTDREILLARTEFDSCRRTLLPPDLAVGAVELERLQPHLEALDALAQDRPLPELVPPSAFDALFPTQSGEGRRGAAPSPGQDLVEDILAAIAEAAPFAPVDDRATEAVRLLQHLLPLYQLSIPMYLEHLAQPSDAAIRAVARIRRTCSPLRGG